MTIRVKKYSRWDESCNWQLESIEEQETKIAKREDLIDVLGFTYCKNYDEYYKECGNSLTVIKVL